MSRIARIELENTPYHITQRGNGRQQIFFEDRDYLLYMDLLREYSAACGLRIWGYCLMPNHVHVLALPERPRAMAQTLGRTHADFARHFNLRRRSCGHVWQARFFSCPMDPAHVWRAMAYVERNPVRAGLAARAEQYPWSSAATRLGLMDVSFLDLAPWRADYTPQQWTFALQSSVDEEAFGRRLHEASASGRPFGAEDFVGNLEKKSGRQLKPRPSGRPRRAQSNPAGQQLALEIGV